MEPQDNPLAGMSDEDLDALEAQATQQLQAQQAVPVSDNAPQQIAQAPPQIDMTQMSDEQLNALESQARQQIAQAHQEVQSVSTVPPSSKKFELGAVMQNVVKNAPDATNDFFQSVPRGIANMADAGVGLASWGPDEITKLISGGQIQPKHFRAGPVADAMFPVTGKHPIAELAGNIAGQSILPSAAGAAMAKPNVTKELVREGVELTRHSASLGRVKDAIKIGAVASGLENMLIGQGQNHSEGKGLDLLQAARDFGLGAVFGGGMAGVFKKLERNAAAKVKIAARAQEQVKRHEQALMDSYANDVRMSAGSPGYEAPFAGDIGPKNQAQASTSWFDEMPVAKGKKGMEAKKYADESTARTQEEKRLQGYQDYLRRKRGGPELGESTGQPAASPEQTQAAPTGVKSTRQKAIEARPPGREATPEEAARLRPIIKAHAEYEAARAMKRELEQQMVAHFQKEGQAMPNAFKNRVPMVAHDALNQMAHEEAGKLGTSIRDVMDNIYIDTISKSVPKGQVNIKGLTKQQMLRRYKLVSEVEQAAEEIYEGLRDDATLGVRQLIQPDTSLHVDDKIVSHVMNRHQYQVKNSKLQAKFEQNFKARQEQYRAKEIEQGFNEKQFDPKGFEKDLNPTPKESAALHDKPEIKGKEAEQIIKELEKNEVPISLAAEYIQEINKWYAKSKGMSHAMLPGTAEIITAAAVVWRRLKQHLFPQGLMHLVFNRLALNELTSDIYRNYAKPEFIAQYEHLMGKLQAATYGVELPRTHATQKMWAEARYMEPADIANLGGLSVKQQEALIRQNEVLDELKDLVDDYIDELGGKTQAAADKYFTQNGRLARALYYDKVTNLDRRSDFSIKWVKAASNHITRGALNAVATANTTLHFGHLHEGAQMILGHAPINGIKSVGKVMQFWNKSDTAKRFAKGFGGTGAIKQLRDDTGNIISDTYNKVQTKIVHAVPFGKQISESKPAQVASDAISGNMIENAKMELAYTAAGMKVAKEMGYKDTEKFMEDFMRQMSTGTPDARTIEAATRIYQHVNKWIGASPHGYRDMTVVDRLATMTHGVARVFVPFTRTKIIMKRAIENQAKAGLQAIGRGDFKGGLSHMGSIGTMFGFTALTTGAVAIPKEIHDLLAEHDPNTLHALTEQLDKLAIVGNALQFRTPHFRYGYNLPNTIGEGFPAQMLKDVQTVQDPKKTQMQRVRAGIMIAAYGGIDNIMGTISIDVARKIYQRITEAGPKGTEGGHVTWVAREINNSEKIGAALSGKDMRSPILDRVVIPNTREDALLHATVLPGEPLSAYKIIENGRHEDNLAQQIKNNYGDKVYNLLASAYYDARPKHRAERKLSRMSPEDKMEFEAELQKRGIDKDEWQRRLNKALYDESTGPTAHFWAKVWEKNEKNPGWLQSVRDKLEPPAPKPPQLANKHEA